MASLSPTHPQPCIARFTLDFSSSLVRRCFQIHLLPSLRYLFCILCRCTLRCWPATPGDPTASGSSYSPFSVFLLGGVPGSCEKVLAPSCGVHCLSSIGAVPLRGGGRPALAPILLWRRVPCWLRQPSLWSYSRIRILCGDYYDASPH